MFGSSINESNLFTLHSATSAKYRILIKGVVFVSDVVNEY